ncbi:hypothetical protein [Burkholderia sp. Bp8998]|nr:hypothetical protein [Burkholderia sp. Bp8998]
MADRHLLLEAGVHPQLHGEHTHRGGEEADRDEHDRTMSEEESFQTAD